MERLENKRAQAEKRVEEIRGFYSHCLVYVLVNLGLFGLNMFSSPDYLWFFWPLAGWGIGLAAHGLSLMEHGLWGEAWKERKIEKLMRKGA